MFSSKGRRVFGDKKEVRGQIWSKRSDRQTDKKIDGQRNGQTDKILSYTEDAVTKVTRRNSLVQNLQFSFYSNYYSNDCHVLRFGQILFNEKNKFFNRNRHLFSFRS